MDSWKESKTLTTTRSLSSDSDDKERYVTAKQEAQKYINELYEEHTGLTKGPVIKALDEMNNELGITDPYCRPFKNMAEHWIDHIPPGGFGVLQAKGASKYLKPVKIIKKVVSSDSDDKDKEVKTDG